MNISCVCFHLGTGTGKNLDDFASNVCCWVVVLVGASALHCNAPTCVMQINGFPFISNVDYFCKFTRQNVVFGLETDRGHRVPMTEFNVSEIDIQNINFLKIQMLFDSHISSLSTSHTG